MSRPTDYVPEPCQSFDEVNAELQRIAALFRELPVQLLACSTWNAAPGRPYTGMIAFADGTNWNPGAGAGYYGYHSGAWNKLG